MTDSASRNDPPTSEPSWQSLLAEPASWPVAAGLGLLWSLSKLPFPYNIRLGKVIGQLLYLLPSKRKHITMVNLQLCFPELNELERQRFCTRVFENYGAGLIETAMAWWMPVEELHSMVEIEGLDILQKAHAQKRGVLLLGAHFSTLDMGNALGNKYFSYSTVYREQKNPFFNAVMNNRRRQHCLSNIKNSNLRELIRALRNNTIVWYAPDQDMGEHNSVFATFFGQPAASIAATAKLAKRTGALVLMYGQYRNKDDSGYRLKITGPLENYPTEDEIADANQVNLLVEQAIRLEPEQYYWFHRRFKTQEGQPKGAIYK